MKKYLILLIVALLSFSSEAISAPPIGSATADSVKVVKELNKKYERQKKERKQVAGLFRDLLEVHKFQFDAYTSNYLDQHSESYMTVRCYGRDISIYDSRTSYNYYTFFGNNNGSNAYRTVNYFRYPSVGSYNGVLHNNYTFDGSFRLEQSAYELNRHRQSSRKRRASLASGIESWYTSTSTFSFENIREEVDHLLFDIMVNAPIRTPKGRMCSDTKLEFHSEIFTGLIKMRVLFLNKQGDIIEHGPIYTGFLNVLR